MNDLFIRLEKHGKSEIDLGSQDLNNGITFIIRLGYQVLPQSLFQGIFLTFKMAQIAAGACGKLFSFFFIRTSNFLG